MCLSLSSLVSILENQNPIFLQCLQSKWTHFFLSLLIVTSNLNFLYFVKALTKTFACCLPNLFLHLITISSCLLLLFLFLFKLCSFFLELFLHSSPVAYWAPTDLGSSSFSVIFFCLFILFIGFSRAEYWSGLPFLSPVDLISSELSTITCSSWVALHDMAHSFTELNKAVIQVISLVSFLLIVVSILSALWCIRIRDLWKLPDGRDWLYLTHEVEYYPSIY